MPIDRLAQRRKKGIFRKFMRSQIYIISKPSSLKPGIKDCMGF